MQKFLPSDIKKLVNKWFERIRARKRWLLISVAIFPMAIVILVVLYPYFPAYIRFHINQCTFNPKYKCYVSNIQTIAGRDGIGGQIEYVKEIVLPKWGFAITHMVLHRVGEEAIYQTGDVSKAIKMIDPYLSGVDIHKDGFDGYMHGVFRGYFKRNNHLPGSELMKQVCGSYYAENKPEIDMETHHGSKSEECFHGTGHALMYLHDNNLEKSRLDCRTAPFEWMQNGCFRGAFMEAVYMYSDFLYDTPLPESYGKSLLNTCNLLEGNEARICSSFVGESYLLKQKRDIQGAYSECRSLHTDDMKQECMDRLAAITLPFYFKDDFHKIIAICKEESGKFYESCIHSVVGGIKIGVAGENKTKEEFCDLIEEDKLRESCLDGH